MILLIRDNECFEPRVQNYLHYFDEHHIDYHVIAWNRNGNAGENKKITFFQRRAEYGKRLKNIPNKLMWMFFVMGQILKYRKNCTAIHACDIDAVIPALLVGKPLGKIVIFDIFDWISSLTGKGFVYKTVEWLQNFCYRHCDAVILCEEERKAQAKASNRNTLVLPNIPNAIVTFDQTAANFIGKQRAGYELTVSYVGVFDRDRGLENLLECVSKNPHVLLNIAGFGVLGELVEQYANQYENIHCWGRVAYAVGQTIQKNSDLIAAMYHLTSPLHKFAAPNKYYESLMLEVPMITTENTLVGTKVQKHETGFVLDETCGALESLLSDPTLAEQIAKKRENCRTVWTNVYCGYYNEFMQNTYLKITSIY